MTNMNCIDRRGILGGLAATAAVASAPTIARADNASVLTVGLLRNPVSGLVALADKKGWFKEAGVNLSTVLFSGAAGPKVIQAMGGGSIGVSSVSSTAVLLALASGAVPLNIISIATDPAPVFALLSAPEIDTVPKLAGKKVATTAGTGLQYFLARALQKHGMTLKDVEFVNMAALDAQSAFLAGRLDAIVPALSGRYYIPGIRKDTRVLFTYQDFAEAPNPTTFVDQDVFAVTQPVLRTQGAQLKGFLAAYHDKAVGYLHDAATQDAAIAEITTYVNTEQKTPTDNDVMRAQLLGSGFLTRAEAKTTLDSDTFRNGLEDQIKFFVDSGQLKTSPDMSGVVSSAFL